MYYQYCVTVMITSFINNLLKINYEQIDNFLPTKICSIIQLIVFLIELLVNNDLTSHSTSLLLSCKGVIEDNVFSNFCVSSMEY